MLSSGLLGTLTPEELTGVLEHEAAHHARRDTAKELTPLSVGTFVREVATGTRALLGEPSLRRALTLSFAEATAGAAAIVVTVVYVREVPARGDTAFALVMADLGVGSSLAALLLGRATGRYERGAKQKDALHARKVTPPPYFCC